MIFGKDRGTCEGHPVAWTPGSSGLSAATIAWLGLPSDFPSMIEMTGPR